MSKFAPIKRSYYWIPAFAIGALGLTIIRTGGCSVNKPDGPPPTPVAACDGLNLGDTKEEACPAGEGKKTYTCAETGLQLVADQCENLGARKPCSSVVTFAQLQPVLALNCAGCHSGIDVYDKARSWYPKIKTNVQPGGSQHMPPGKQLAADQMDLIARWGADGYLKADECDGTTTGGGGQRPGSLSFPQIEQAVFANVSALNADDQKDYRYLLYTDRIHAGDSVETLAIYKTAAAKVVASVSPERNLYPPEEIAPGVLRIDIDELGISAAQWTLIENASQLQLESQTNVGKVLKALTGARLPIMFLADFQDVVLRNATIYYNLTRAPATFGELVNKLGVDFNNDLKQSKATLVGFNGSLLSPAANRLMARFESDDGVFWMTGDTGPIKNDGQDIFKNPLLAAAGGKANLQFAAGEILYTLPNGMMGSFLFDATGKRLDFADPNVVHDFTSNPVAPIIRVGLSCLRCHASGYLAATDQVRAAISGGSNLSADDVQRVLSLYRRQTEVDRLFAQDNAANASASRKSGVDVTQPDPISKVSDLFLGDMKLADIAGFFSESGADFTADCLNVSPAVQAKASPLKSGGTLSHDQFVLAVKTIVSDCRKFQDPL